MRSDQNKYTSLLRAFMHNLPLSASLIGLKLANLPLIGQYHPKHARVRSSMAAPMAGVDKPSAKHSALNTTSFQKKTRSKLISIPGSRPSVQNGQLLVSTGVTSLDYLLG